MIPPQAPHKEAEWCKQLLAWSFPSRFLTEVPTASRRCSRSSTSEPLSVSRGDSLTSRPGVPRSIWTLRAALCCSHTQSAVAFSLSERDLLRLPPRLVPLPISTGGCQMGTDVWVQFSCGRGAVQDGRWWPPGLLIGRPRRRRTRFEERAAPLSPKRGKRRSEACTSGRNQQSTIFRWAAHSPGKRPR